MIVNLRNLLYIINSQMKTQNKFVTGDIKK